MKFEVFFEPAPSIEMNIKLTTAQENDELPPQKKFQMFTIRKISNFSMYKIQSFMVRCFRNSDQPSWNFNLLDDLLSNDKVGSRAKV